MPIDDGRAERTYQRTHPWIDFRFDLSDLKPADWMHLGEAAAKIQWISSAVLLPEISEQLHSIYLAKGIQATAAIEGNTLDEEEVRLLIEGDLRLPRSQQYLAQEVQNVLDACNGIARAVERGNAGQLSAEAICRYNAQVLRGLDLEEGAVAGEVRKGSVVVGRYRGAPAEDCRHLLDRLCEWLNGPDFRPEPDDDYRFLKLAAKAAAAHLYLAFIHPFDDGNGRTARLVELRILVEGGLPLAACHLLSNHYNRTRTRYYRVLDRASRVEPYGAVEFFSYALTGLAEGLEKQTDWIVENQLKAAWENYINEQFAGRDTPAGRRRAMLARGLHPERPTPRSEITRVSPRVAEAYAGKTSKTVTRDLNRLLEMSLIRRASNRGYASNPSLLKLQQPRRAVPAGGAGETAR